MDAFVKLNEYNRNLPYKILKLTADRWKKNDSER